MNLGFMPLVGDDQCGEFAQLLLASDRSLPRPPPPPLPDFSQPFHFPVIANLGPLPELNLADIVSVQPMTAPPTGMMRLEFITAEESKAMHDAELAAYTADLGEGEVLREFEFGGILSMRGGYFVTHKDRPNLVLRYAVTRMS